MMYISALLIGVVAGIRALTALAAVSWAAHLGWLPLENTTLAFLGYQWTPWIFTILALGEYVTDVLPQTPSRKVPVQLGARLVSGGFSGAAIGLAGGSWLGGLVAGLIGAVIGTYGSAPVRASLAEAFGRDLPAAFIEDAIAIVISIAIVAVFMTH